MIQKKYTHNVSLSVTKHMYEQLIRLSDEWECSIAGVMRDFIIEGLSHNPDFPDEELTERERLSR